MGTRGVRGAAATEKPKFKFSEGFIQEALEGFFAENSVKYFMDNLYVFGWESDKLIETKTGYIYEFEIKISVADFKNDFKHKGDKHAILMGEKASGKKYVSSYLEIIEGLKERAKTSSYALTSLRRYEEQGEKYRIDNRRKPNVFYYAVPDGLINAEDVPEYAGLIYVNEHGRLQIVKKAPYLHKNKYNDAELKLGEKFYYHMVDWKRNFWRARRSEAEAKTRLKTELETKGSTQAVYDAQKERDYYKEKYFEKLSEKQAMERLRNDVVATPVAKIREYEPNFNYGPVYRAAIERNQHENTNKK